jgi:transmembrane sensor
VNPYNTIDEDLLVKYLANDTTDEETFMVENWIQASDENKKQFEQFLLIWEQSLQLTAPISVNVDDAWMRMQQRIKKEVIGIMAVPVRSFSKSWLRIAAAIIIVVCVGGLTYVLDSKNSGEQIVAVKVASVNNVVTDTLPDGTVITVNKNSTLSYPSKFKGDTREVALNGEAFFKVTPDKEKPFIIHVNDVIVRVVGTSFNIKSENGKTEVIVETGIVQVTKNKHTVRLLPKEKSVTQWRDSTLAKDTVQDQLYSYYRSKEFICNNTPLHSLVETLNEAYNVHIIIENDALKDLPITTVFKGESLDNILAVISETFKINIEKTGNQIILR